MTFLDDYLLSLFPEDEDRDPPADDPRRDTEFGEEDDDYLPLDERWPRRPQ